VLVLEKLGLWCGMSDPQRLRTRADPISGQMDTLGKTALSSTRTIKHARCVLLLGNEPHQTLLKLDSAESIQRFSLNSKPVPELPEERVLGYPHEYRRDS
jgi:hypothetical protein